MTKTTGFVVAAAAAALFTAGCASHDHASVEHAASHPGRVGHHTFHDPKVTHEHKCKGHNHCKGDSGCATKK